MKNFVSPKTSALEALQDIEKILEGLKELETEDTYYTYDLQLRPYNEKGYKWELKLKLEKHER